jgi:methionyl-tRNA synthetase
VLWVLAETIRRVTLLVQPFMPGSTAKILDQLAVPADNRSFAAFEREIQSGTPLPKPEGGFPRFVEAAKAAS